MIRMIVVMIVGASVVCAAGLFAGCPEQQCELGPAGVNSGEHNPEVSARGANEVSKTNTQFGEDLVEAGRSVWVHEKKLPRKTIRVVLMESGACWVTDESFRVFRSVEDAVRSLWKLSDRDLDAGIILESGSKRGNIPESSFGQFRRFAVARNVNVYSPERHAGNDDFEFPRNRRLRLEVRSTRAHPPRSEAASELGEEKGTSLILTPGAPMILPKAS